MLVTKYLGLNMCRYHVTTAAPISQNTMDYFSDMGIQLHNIYGMSETTGPISVSDPLHGRHGSVGKVLPDIDLKIQNNEILVRGPTVFGGYYRNYKDTKIAFDNEGWLYTGDMGYVDNDNYLYITGREKDIIITSGGEMVSPGAIESAIKAVLPIMEHAVVIGDKKKYISLILLPKLQKTDSGDETILFTPDAQQILKDIGSRSNNIIDAVEDHIIKEYIDRGVQTVNKLAKTPTHTVKRWIIVPKVFTERGGELTPTMKLKRAAIIDKYKDYIEKLY